MNLRNEPHDGYEQGAGPAVIVRFKSSSQPKGQDGYELAVSSDATEADVDRTMYLAARAREQAVDVLEGNYNGSPAEADQIERRRATTLFPHLAPGEELIIECAIDGREVRAHTQAEWEACQEQIHDRRVEELRAGEQAHHDAAEGAYERMMMQDQRA